MSRLDVGPLPHDPLGAAARFYDAVLPKVTTVLQDPPSGENLVIVFQLADHTHRQWRLAAIQELARQSVPVRVNAIESDDQSAIAASIAYLGAAPGVTGQLLRLDGGGAGPML